MREKLGRLIDVVAELIDALERSGVDYALGGALAYSTWAEPRATQDVDLNVWLSLDQIDGLFALLEGLAAVFDRREATRAAKERGMFVARKDGYRLDIFVPSVEFYAEALKRRKRVRIARRDTWVLSAETLVVFKMLFFRPKDLVDVRRLLEIQGGAFDRLFVRRWLVRMLGEDDERILTWDRDFR